MSDFREDRTKSLGKSMRQFPKGSDIWSSLKAQRREGIQVQGAPFTGMGKAIANLGSDKEQREILNLGGQD